MAGGRAFHAAGRACDVLRVSEDNLSHAKAQLLEQGSKRYLVKPFIRKLQSKPNVFSNDSARVVVCVSASGFGLLGPEENQPFSFGRMMLHSSSAGVGKRSTKLPGSVP